MGCLLPLSCFLLSFLIFEFSSLIFTVLLTVTLVLVLARTTLRIIRSRLSSAIVFLLYLVVYTFLRTYSLLVFFIMYELSLLPVLTLILFFGYQPEKINSITYLLLYTVICSAPFLYFAVTLDSSIYSGFSSLAPYASSLVALSFLVKSPLYTLHT